MLPRKRVYAETKLRHQGRVEASRPRRRRQSVLRPDYAATIAFLPRQLHSGIRKLLANVPNRDRARQLFQALRAFQRDDRFDVDLALKRIRRVARKSLSGRLERGRVGNVGQLLAAFQRRTELRRRGAA